MFSSLSSPALLQTFSNQSYSSNLNQETPGNNYFITKIIGIFTSVVLFLSLAFLIISGLIDADFAEKLHAAGLAGFVAGGVSGVLTAIFAIVEHEANSRVDSMPPTARDRSIVSTFLALTLFRRRIDRTPEAHRTTVMPNDSAGVPATTVVNVDGGAGAARAARAGYGSNGVTTAVTTAAWAAEFDPDASRVVFVDPKPNGFIVGATGGRP